MALVTNSDNTLGAPTVGLGQTATFAVDLPQAEALSLPGQPGVNVGIQGGQVIDRSQYNALPQEHETALGAAIKQVADKYIGLEAKQLRADRYNAGMMEAAQGKAIKDIVRDTPWYSQLWGAGDAVEGARAYAGHETVGKVSSMVAAELPNTKSMSPDQATEYFRGKLNPLLTGDGPTDAYVMQAWGQQLPGLMSAQAKLHYGWRQERALDAFNGALNGQARHLANVGDLVAGGFMTKDDLSVAGQQALAMSMPPEGMDEKVWKSTITSKIREWAADGNMHAVNAFLDAGLQDHLTGDESRHLEQAVIVGDQRARTKYTELWQQDLLKLRLQAERPQEGQTTNELLSGIDQINQQFKTASGSKAPLISPHEREALASRSSLYIDAARRARMQDDMKTAGRVAVAETKDALIRRAIAEGNTGQLVVAKVATENDIDQTISRIVAESPGQAVPVLAAAFRQDGKVVKQIADERLRSVDTMLQAGNNGYDASAVGTVYNDWLSMHTVNPNLSAAYYGKRDTDMLRFHQAKQSMGSDAAAFTQAFMMNHKGNTPDRKVLEAAVTAVSAEYDYHVAWARPDKYDIDPSSRDTLASLIAPEVQRRTAGVVADEAEVASSVLKETINRGDAEVLGGYVILNPTNDKRKFGDSLATAVVKTDSPIPTDKVNTAFNQAIQRKLYGDGKTAGVLRDTSLFGKDKIKHATIVRLPSVGDVPVIQFHGVSEDGQVVDFPITQREVLLNFNAAATPASQPPRGNRPRDLTRPSDFFQQRD